MKYVKKINAFLNDESGPTAVEYAVMLALILVAVITIVRNVGVSASSTFATVNSALPSSTGS